MSEQQNERCHVAIHPTGIVLRPNSDRVLNRLSTPSKAERVSGIIDRICSFSEAEVEAQLVSLRMEFKDRRSSLEASWLLQFEMVNAFISPEEQLSANRRLLIGAYFTKECAIESVALSNPSIIPHPDQTGLGGEDLRFILSLRAVGDGHISSIEFRSGVIRGDHSVEIDETSTLVTSPHIEYDSTFAKSIFLDKLRGEGLENNWSQSVMNALGETFNRTEINQAMQHAAHNNDVHSEYVIKAMQSMRELLETNYDISFRPSVPLVERVIFPVSFNENNGMEDARFVRFIDEDHGTTYYATYSAYDGRLTLPQLIETTDFLRFRIRTLNGSVIQNKGMALFPRRIDGHYAMLSRHDDESVYLSLSDDLYLWNAAQLLLRPEQPWELVQIGNCGSPIETDAGWLVLTHGVGPIRKHSIGAVLLDLEDPRKVIGRLTKPLLEPSIKQANGHVPNVLYTCGALVHGGRLVLPYGLNDTTTAIVTVELEALLGALMERKGSCDEDCGSRRNSRSVN